MGLFGLIKTYGEEITTTVKEWFGVDYIVASLSTAGGAIASAYLGEYIPTALKVPEKWYIAARSLVKVGLSGLFYYLGKAAGAPTVGLGASLGSFASLIIDIVKYITKGSPEELGKLAGLKLAGAWKSAVSSPSPELTGYTVPTETAKGTVRKARYVITSS